MESFVEQIEHHNTESSPSYEGGDYTNLTIERIKNSRIQEQIISLIIQANAFELKRRKDSGEMAEFVRTEEQNGRTYHVYKSANGDEVTYTERRMLEMCTDRDVIEDELTKAIAAVENVTGITFEPGEAGGNTITKEICVSVGLQIDDKKLGVREMDLVVAHEKGHVVRPYNTEFYRTHFAPGFDFNPSTLSEFELEETRSALKEYYNTDVVDDTMVISYFETYLFSGSEIAERMAQLKNWAGVGPDKNFELEDLDRARKKYFDDIDFDNDMSIFFQAITSETEEKFIELINSSGI